MLALTQTPSLRMDLGVRTYVGRTEIDFSRALDQHAEYCRLLAGCGAAVRVLETNAHFPDGVFLEDTAVVLDEVAIVASMGTSARRGELPGIELVLREYREVERIELPALLEGGDVLRIGRKLLVGLSDRTDAAGIAALAALAGRYGYSLATAVARGCLHLKTACTALPDGRLLVNPDWLDVAALKGSEWIAVPEQEPWGANVLLIGDQVLLPAAHERTAALVAQLGFTPRSVDISEFTKAEGGVTCLSLLLA